MNRDRRRERSRSRSRDRRDRRDLLDARRDLQSSSSAAEKASRLRMDSATERNRTRPASPQRRKEIDNVMKKARRDGTDKSQFWNRKLLEVEQKDPNRWRHSGYKELYEKSSSVSRSRSRSRSPAKKLLKNRERVRSPPRARRSRSPAKNKLARPAPVRGRPASPPPAKRKSPPRRKSRSMSSSSSSGSSSCNDSQCSVCSPLQTRRKASNNAGARPARSRSRSFSVPRSRKPAPSGSKPAPGPAAKSLVTIGRKPPTKPTQSRVEAVRSARDKGSPPRDPRQTASVIAAAVNAKKKDGPDKNKRSKLLAAVKIEGQKRPVPPDSDSDDSSSSSDASAAGGPKMTLSERFGKMAQWSVDRRDVDYMKNMRITKESDSTGFKVVIDGPEDEDPYRTAAPEFSDRRVGAGFFPEAMHSAPDGLSSWDDVRVRYKYYKGRGYLRDLSMDDYIKWEEWWYKYQEWLEAERYFEQWGTGRASRRDAHRRYRKRSVTPLD